MRRLQLVEPTEPQELPAIPGGLRIAFATQDMHRVDAHFGSARAIQIYEIGPDSSRLIEAIEFETVADESGNHDESTDRIEAKVEALKGCVMLFVLAIGGGAAARVVNANIYPVKVKMPEAISDTVARVQAMLKGSPPPWLRKLMQRNDPADMDFVED